jgi:hypothetical protein
MMTDLNELNESTIVEFAEGGGHLWEADDLQRKVLYD